MVASVILVVVGCRWACVMLSVLTCWCGLSLLVCVLRRGLGLCVGVFFVARDWSGLSVVGIGCLWLLLVIIGCSRLVSVCMVGFVVVHDCGWLLWLACWLFLFVC